MWSSISVFVIVAVAAFWFGKRIWLQFKPATGKACSTGCGCEVTPKKNSFSASR